MTQQTYTPLRLFTPEEAAAYFGISIALLLKLDLKPVRSHRRNFYRVRDIAAFVEKHFV